MVPRKTLESLQFLGAILIGILGAFYLPWLSGKQAFFQSDLTYYFQPFSNFIVDSYKHGRLPLWNPYLYCGMPQLAVPSPGMFYPPAVVFLLLPFSAGLASYMVLHQLIAGIGAFLLVALFGWGSVAAVVAGVAAALCGFMFALIYNYTLVASACWLPLLLFATLIIDSKFDRTNVLKMFGAAICMFCMVAAGRPEVSVPSALIVGMAMVAAALAMVWAPPSVGTSRHASVALARFALQSLALISGCILALPILLPAMEWVKLSPRAHGLELQWVLMWSANWYDAVCLVLAQPLGDLTHLGNKYLDLVASRQHAVPYLTSAYVGPVVATLAIWALGERKWHWKWAAVALFIGSLVMALGSNTPIAGFVSKLSPAFSAFRYPVKLMIFPAWALMVLAARGAYLSVRKEVSTVGFVASTVVWSLIAFAALAFDLIPNLRFLTGKFPWNAHKVINYRLMLDAQHAFADSMAIAAAVGIAIIICYAAYRRTKISEGIFGSILVGALAVTLLLPAVSYAHKGTVGNFYERPNTFAGTVRTSLGLSNGPVHIPARALTLAFDPLSPGLKFLDEQHLDFQQSFYLYARHLMLPNANVDFQVPYSFGYEAGEVGQFKELFSNALSKSTQNRAHDPSAVQGDQPMARFCYMTSTSRVITQVFRFKKNSIVVPMDKTLFKLVAENLDQNYRLYEPVNRLPRAYFADEIVWNAKFDDFFDDFERTDSNAMLSKTYVEGPEDGSVARSGESMPRPSAEEIRFTADQDQHVSLQTKASSPRLLVLTDQHYPGWNAYVDGRRVPMHRVNFFARGIVVPAGQHTVQFSYEPTSLTVGFIAMAGILVAFMLGFIFAPASTTVTTPTLGRIESAESDSVLCPRSSVDRTPPS